MYVYDTTMKLWQPAVIEHPADCPGSYWVVFPTGYVVRRTHSVLKLKSSQTHGEFHSQTEVPEQESVRLIFQIMLLNWSCHHFQLRRSTLQMQS